MKERKLLIQIDWDNLNEKETESFKDIAINIARLYEYSLPSVNTKKIQKIVVTFSAKHDQFYLIPDNLDSDIVIAYKTFDFEKFNVSNIQEKKELVLRCTFDVLSIIFDRIELGKSILKFGYDQIIRDNFALTVDVCGLAKLNRRKDISAKVVAEYFVGYVMISVLFFSKNHSMIRKTDLFKTVPHYFIYLQLVYKTKWLNNEVFQVSNKSSEINILIDIQGATSLHYSPSGRTIDELKEHIKFLTEELYIEI